MPVMHTPRTVDIEITSRCNLRCTYCYYFDNESVTYKDLPTEDWLRFFNELGRNRIMSTCLSGGEPFIREDLPTLLDAIVQNRMRYSILSNGSLITDRIASFISSTNRCDSIQISVDGSTHDIHDTCRGTGAFEGAIRGIKTLQRHNIDVTVRLTVHRQNLHDLENTVRLLLDDLSIPAITTNAAGYIGACRQHSADVLLSTEDRMSAMETLSRLAKRYEGRISAMAGPLEESRRWAEMERARMEGAPPFANGGRLTGCGCPSDKIAVRADGAIVPCTMLAHMELGRINRDDFGKIWREHPGMNGLRKRHMISLRAFDSCAGCGYREYCTGNCPGLAWSLTGEVDAPSPDACLKRFLDGGGSLREAPEPVEALL